MKRIANILLLIALVSYPLSTSATEIDIGEVDLNVIGPGPDPVDPVDPVKPDREKTRYEKLPEHVNPADCVPFYFRIGGILKEKFWECEEVVVEEIIIIKRKYTIKVRKY